MKKSHIFIANIGMSMFLIACGQADAPKDPNLFYLSVKEEASKCKDSGSIKSINFVEGKNFDQLEELAKKEKKLLFVYFHNKHCGACRIVEREAFVAKEVAFFFNKNFIPVKIDSEQDEGPYLSKRYKINSFPTYLFISPDGQIVDNQEGTLKPKDIIELGNEALGLK
jgi:thioredoxin-related protein